MNQNYSIQPPMPWVEQIDNDTLIHHLRETEFSKRQTDEGKDYCYLLRKYYHTSDESDSEYLLMAYTLNEPDNLKRASVIEQVLYEGETYLIHRISVYRDGALIDKLPDTTFKVMDNENESDGGIFNNSKKVNITIKDLRLYDIIIIEDTYTKQFTERDLIRKKYCCKIWKTPDTYWAYGTYDLKFINERNSVISCKKVYFKDENDNLLPFETTEIQLGETFELQYKDYHNAIDTKREVFPYIGFSTQASWEELSSFIAPYYEKVLCENPLASFAPELIKQLDEIPDKDHKIQYAIEYVQNYIRYIYNAFEMHGHLPQSPDITYKNKQGDCKAKSVLLKSILDYLGVESEVVLVNIHSDGYLQYYMPSLLAFNHVMLKIHDNGRDYFVDPTLLNEYGTLPNRNFLAFLNYLPIRSGAVLQQRPAYTFPDYAIDDKVTVDVKNGQGTIKVVTRFKFNRANYIRRYFKNTNKQEIIDSWNTYAFYAMNFHCDRNAEDIRNVFKTPEIGIVSDDKSENEVFVEYTATIENPYYKDNEGRRFLMFFDNNVLKDVKDYNFKDFPYWHHFDSARFEIHLNTDESIDTKEKYTVQELDIQHKYLKYSSKKDIRKNGGSVYIEYLPVGNVEVPNNELDDLKEQYRKIADSNYGLGIDIIEKGLVNKLKFGLKKMLK